MISAGGSYNWETNYTTYIELLEVYFNSLVWYWIVDDLFTKKINLDMRDEITLHTVL